MWRKEKVRVIQWIEVLIKQSKAHLRMKKLRFNIGKGRSERGKGRYVSLVFEILRSMCLWGYKWKCPIGHCVNWSMVQKRHLGDTNVKLSGCW